MRILLVMPRFPESGMSLAMRSPPLGLMAIAGAIDRAAHHIELIDLNVRQLSDAELTKRMQGFDLIGVSMMTNVYIPGMHVLKLAKATGARTIAGGFHPSLCPEMVESPDVDLVVRGEGEVAFAELVNENKPLEDILGLSYWKDGEAHHNPDRPLLTDLDSLPMPARDIINPSDYFYVYLPTEVIEGSRGCPFACEFCCVSSVYHRKYREKSAERVLEEMKRLEPTTRVVFFCDDNFTMNMKRVDRICDMIESEIDQKLIMACQSRIDTIVKHPDTIAKMSRVGFKVFFLGIESIHQKALDHMGKQVKREDIETAVDILDRNGALSYGSFIVGNVGETREDVESTMEFIKKTNFTFIQAGAITPYPSTGLYHEAIEKGWLKPELHDWWTKEHPHAMMDTADLTADEIGELTHDVMKAFYYYWPRYVKPSNWARILSRNYGWWRSVAPRVIRHGIKDFLLRF